MKNFTNNFKQFTSRLSARWLIMALMLLVGTSSVWATIDVYPGETIIIDVSSHSWFNNDNCYPKLYCGNTVIGQASGFESDKQYEITLTITSVVKGRLYVSRCNSNGEYNKQYIDDRSSSKINTFKITGDGNGKWYTTQSSTNIYYLRGLGDFDKWNNIKNPYTIYLNKGEYEFKVYDSNDNWYGNNGTMTRDNCSNWAMETDKNNCKITADVAGNYTFTFNSTTQRLSVTYPELPCYTLSDVDPGTISSNATNNAICGSGSVKLTLSNTTSKNDLTRTIQWQKYNGSAWSNISNATATTYTETISATTKYRAKVTWTKSGCNNLVEYSSENGFTITVNALPSKPIFDAIPAQCGSYTLPAKDKDQVNVNWYTAATGGDKIITPVTQSGTYYAEAVNANKCTSAERTPVQITINTKPSIGSITQSVTSPVPFEDVVLTANDVTSGAEVRWYLGNDETPVATGTTYVVTSENAGEVTVKAKAFLGGCESGVATKTVTFSVEDCSNSDVTIESTKIEIWCRETGSSQAGSNLTCYAWYNDGNNHDLNSDNTNKGTKTSVTKTSNIEGQEYTYRVWEFDMQNYGDYDVYVIFKKSTTKWDWQTSNLKAGKRNNRYFFIYDGSQNEQSKRGEQYSKSESLSVTTRSITAPAVKTVSVNSEQGSGVVDFTGQIIKTGCAATSKIYYGYQFKKADEEWPTIGVEASNTPVKGKLIPLTNASETALYYQFSADVENLEDGDYHFRAYIINGYDFTNGNYDQGVYYGLDKLVTVNNVKTPISGVTLNYCNEKGTIIDDPNPMCKGATAYVKLSYRGSKYSDIKWLVEGVETKLVTDEGDGVWSYIIQGDGSLSVELKNDANTDPAWPYSNKLSFTMKKEPADPYISIDPASGIICEGSTATIKVENPSKDCSYKLVEEGSKAGFTPYKSGDLTYTVENVGKYYVVAQHNECTANEYTSNQVAINQIISTSATISIEPNNPETTPWEPVTITVKPAAGYIYELTYTDGNLAAVDGVRIKQNGDSYTYYIPRPWTTGDSNPVRTAVNYGIKAQLKVDGEASECKLNYATATIQLKDEDNENCPK